MTFRSTKKLILFFFPPKNNRKSVIFFIFKLFFMQQKKKSNDFLFTQCCWGFFSPTVLFRTLLVKSCLTYRLRLWRNSKFPRNSSTRNFAEFRISWKFHNFSTVAEFCDQRKSCCTEFLYPRNSVTSEILF